MCSGDRPFYSVGLGRELGKERETEKGGRERKRGETKRERQTHTQTDT